MHGFFSINNVVPLFRVIVYCFVYCLTNHTEHFFCLDISMVFENLTLTEHKNSNFSVLFHYIYIYIPRALSIKVEYREFSFLWNKYIKYKRKPSLSTKISWSSIYDNDRQIIQTQSDIDFKKWQWGFLNTRKLFLQKGSSIQNNMRCGDSYKYWIIAVSKRVVNTHRRFWYMVLASLHISFIVLW